MRVTPLVGLALVALVLPPGVAAAGQPAPPAAAPNVTDGTTPTLAAVGDGTIVTGEVSDGTPAEGDACDPVAGGEQRENPAEDSLGWENGCWHDDPLATTVEDGLNETELDAVVARTMARVEYIRRLEFNETVPVEVISRATFRNRTAGQFTNVSTENRLHQNVKYEALFFVPENESAVAQLAANQGGSVLGYYSHTEDRIVIVSDSEGALAVDGPTLAHELAHALQDQQFNLSRYERATTEEDNAVSGLLEGDPTYTEYLYDQRCGEAWSCPSRDGDSGGNPGGGFHWGIYFTGFQPYSDGGALVARLREQGGWDAVDAAYENPPTSSEQVMYPRKYPEERPTNVTVADRSTEAWRVLDLDHGIDYAAYGEPGMASMFISPTYEDDTAEFVGYSELRTGDELDPLNYTLEYTDGWDGDRLYPYVTNHSATTNETAYVWKTAWDTPADARDFEEGYVEMLVYRGAEPVPGREDTYRIPDGEPYEDAFHVNRTGDTVVVVNAPTVLDLQAVRGSAAPRTPVPSPGTEPAAAPVGRGTVPSDWDSPVPSTNRSLVPGAAMALLVVLAAALLLRWR
jgi:hypothetical protein